MQMATETTLADEGMQLLAVVGTYITHCEDRLAYRKEHGRQLSKAHEEALTGLRARLGVLTARLDALLGPDVDALRADFEALRARLEE